MKYIKLALLSISFSACVFSANAQAVKPLFKQFIAVSYHANDSTGNLGIILENYYRVDNKGIVHFIYNNYYGPNFSGIETDTSYMASDELIIALNKIIKENKKLISHQITNQLPYGSHFAGTLEYISFIANNNSADGAIIVDAFFDNEIEGILDRFFAFKIAKTNHRGKIYHNKVIEGQIMKYHKACTYIPNFEAPPNRKKQ